MSEWKQIWTKAIEANQRMGAELERGEAEFAVLLNKYQDDGMVYYSRGEGYESRGLLQLALHDYESAEKHMPVPHWKAVASLAAERIKRKQKNVGDANFNPIWTAFHRVYAAWQAPHRVRVKALFAIPGFDSEPDSVAVAFRSCLELTVRMLMSRPTTQDATESDLRRQVDQLVSDGKVSRRVAFLMHNVRRLGNKAVHGETVGFGLVLRDFPEILEKVCWPRLLN